MFEPRYRFGVQMVGRFVEQQQVGLFQQQLGQRDAATLATGNLGDVGILRRAAQRIHGDFDFALDVPGADRFDLFLQIALLFDELVHFIIVGHFAEFHGDFVETIEQALFFHQRVHDVFHHVLGGVELGFLRQVADTYAVGGPGLAYEVLFDTRHDLEQGRFTRAVRAKYADFYPRQKGKVNALKDFLAAGKGLGQVLHYVNILICSHKNQSVIGEIVVMQLSCAFCHGMI